MTWEKVDGQHKQVIAKVSAYVDEGIMELMELLNSIEGIRTFENCQGENDKPAFIYFEYGKGNTNFKEIVKSAQKISKLLSKLAEQGTGISPEPIYDIKLSVEWWGDKKHPFISIRMPPDSIKEVTNIFLAVRRELENDK